MIVYCHQHRPIHIHIPQLNFRYQRADSMDVLHYYNSGLLLCAMLIPSSWLGSVILSCDIKIAQPVFVLTFSTAADTYLRFPYLRIPSLLLTFSVLAFSVATAGY